MNELINANPSELVTGLTGFTIFSVIFYSWVKKHLSGTETEVARQRAEQNILEAYRVELCRALETTEAYRKRLETVETKFNEATIMIGRLETKIDNLTSQLLDAEALIANANAQCKQWQKRYDELFERTHASVNTSHNNNI